MKDNHYRGDLLNSTKPLWFSPLSVRRASRTHQNTRPLTIVTILKSSQPVFAMVSFRVVVFCSLLALVAATDVEQCPGKSIEGLSNDVALTPCKRPPCKLKKGTTQHITIKFTPEKDLSEVKNHVTADVFGVPLPFIGVDGNSVCEKLETEAGEKASCPLKAGTKYVYKDSFPVHNFYPSINVKVHWSIRDGETDVACFEVPARIS